MKVSQYGAENPPDCATLKQGIPMKGLWAVATLIATQLNAQTVHTPKDAGIATVLSIVIPGGGQMYAEETGRGIAFLALTAASIGVGVGFSTKATPDIVVPAFLSIPSVTYPGTPANRTPLLVGSLVGGVVWLWSVFDAAPAANRTNAKRAQRLGLVPVPNGMGVRFTF